MLLYAGGAAASALLLAGMAGATSLRFAYCAYACSTAVQQLLQCALHAQAAAALDAAACGGGDPVARGQRYSLLFAVNGALALCVQTLAQAAVGGANLSTRAQFAALAAYAGLTSAAVGGAAAVAGRGVAWGRGLNTDRAGGYALIDDAARDDGDPLL